jgi:hypothetical protein
MVESRRINARLAAAPHTCAAITAPLYRPSTNCYKALSSVERRSKARCRGALSVILLVFVAVLWIVVLAPSVLRRIRERGGVVSVDHFHHQLELLEHAGPKLVTPAYRLRSGQSGAGSSAVVSSRPKLVLLRAVHDGQAADIDDVDGARYARVGVIEPPEPPVSPAQTHAELTGDRRHQARQRCTLVLRLLAATAVTTGILGVLPALRLAWIFTGITGIATLALAGLIAYARELEGQRQQSRTRAWDHRAMAVEDDRPDTVSLSRAARSGLPGAWDEDEFESGGIEGPESLPQRRTATGG